MKNIIILLLVTLTLERAAAQANPELKGMIKQSFSYFPRIQELEKSTEISEVRSDLTRTSYLPVITGNASYTYINPVGETSFPISNTESRSIQFQPYDNYNANIALNQLLWDFGKTQAQIERTKSDLQASQYAADAARLQLAAQVTNVYYGLIYLKQSLLVQDSVILFYEQNKKIIESRIRQGDALLVDLSNIDNSIEQERSRKVEFQRQFDRQAALLQYTTGVRQVPTTTTFDFASGASPQAWDQNPEVLAATQRLHAAESDLRLANKNKLPSLNLIANAGFKNGYQPDIQEIRFNYLAGVSLTVPIFQGRRLYQNSMLSKKSVELTQYTRNNLTAGLQKDMEMSAADERAYAEQIQHSEAQIKAATEALRLNRVRYARGVTTYLDLVYASTNLQRAVLNKLQFEYQRCLAQVEQTRLAGIRFWEE